MGKLASDRVRTLLLRADNTLKSEAPDGDPTDRVARARRTLQEARELAGDPSVPAAVAGLVERRLASLDALEAEGHGPAGR